MCEDPNRLPDWAFTEDELDNMAKDLLEPASITGKKHLVIYHIYKDSVDTGIAMLLATESISDGLHAINRIWSGLGLYAEIGEFTEDASETSEYRLKSIEIVLDKFKYIPKVKLTGWNKMYIYKKWYKELL